MSKEWYNFQEKIKDIFYKLGCDAKTNFKIQGVRTSHDIDVYVTNRFLGHNIKWIIEAKLWNKSISKLHVLGLRQIVDDTGVDKGFIISQKGFQKGAKEAANLSNISLLTFDELEKLSLTTKSGEEPKTDPCIPQLNCRSIPLQIGSSSLLVKGYKKTILYVLVILN